MSVSVILIKAAQLILSLSILVVLHELGHFIAAKVFKCRVDKFYLFFDPWFALFKVKKGETEYGVGWLPLGGYVKIAGMIDESMDKEQMKQPPQPWEFRSKPAWQRLIVMVAGVTMNILLAFFIFAMILWGWGEKRIPMSSLKYGISVTDSLGNRLGFQSGDHIEAVNGKPVQYYEDFIPELIYAKDVTLLRDGKTVTVDMPENLVGQIINNKTKANIFQPRLPVIVDEVPDTSTAKVAGLLKGDHILAINKEETRFFDQLKNNLDRNKGESVVVQVLRPGQGSGHISDQSDLPQNIQLGDTVELTMPVSSDGTLGFILVSDPDTLTSMGVLSVETHKYGFLSAFPAGVNMAIDKLGEYVKQFKLIFQPSTGAYKGLGGFGTIAKAFAPTWDWQVFWMWTAILSVILAFMNILPIPALDGGHVLFLLAEMITGRKPSDKFLEYAQVAGMIILFGLLLFANGMDVWRSIKDWLGH